MKFETIPHWGLIGWLVPLALAAILLAVRGRGPGPFLWVAQRGVLLVALVLLAAAPFFPWTDSRQEGELVVLADRSGSVQPASDQIERAASDLGTRAAERGLPCRRIDFAADPCLSPLDPTSTDLVAAAAAARLAPALAPGERRVALLSDGRGHTGLPPADSRLDLPAGAEAPTAADCRATLLLLPGEVDEGQVFRAALSFEASGSGQASAFLAEAGKTLAEIEVEFRPGMNWARFPPIELPQGEHPLEARILAGDPYPENDAARAAVRVGPALSVLVVAGKAAGDDHLERALSAQGVQVAAQSEAAFSESPPDLSLYRAVVFHAVHPDRISPAAQKKLASYVREGGGFLLVGGPGSLGPRGWRDTPLAEILPVEFPEPPPPPEPETGPDEPPPDDPANEGENKTEEGKPEDAPPEKETVEVPRAALVLVIDKSGSMEGEKIRMAKESAIAAAEALAPEDYLGVVAFDAEPYWVLPLTLAKSRDRVENLVARLATGGDTYLYPALIQAHEALAALEEAHLKHVIVLSDGETRIADHRELVERMVADRITVSAIGIGTDYDRRLMPRIAQWGKGNFVSCTEVRTVPEFVIRDATRVLRVDERKELLAGGDADEILPEEGPLPEVHAPDPESAAPAKDPDTEVPPDVERPREEIVPGEHLEKKGKLAVFRGLPAPALAGVEGEFPPLAGAHVLPAREGASVHLEVAGEDGVRTPLLVSWRAGLGKCAVLATGAEPPWALDWIAWADYGRFLAQGARWLAADLPAPSYSLEISAVEWRRDGVRIEVRLVDGEGRPAEDARIEIRASRDGVAIEANVRDLGGALHEVTLETAQRDALIRLEGVASAPDPIPLAPLWLDPPPAAEWADLTSPAPGPEEIARATGGRAGVSPSALARPLDREVPRRDPFPVEAGALVLAIIGLEILARRILARR
ncbi:MAG: VWA domain-containing protein [Planctomycetes bacterium]|nr:VWA domain-containing protein [Planctomycetota bacterium]